jgi:hypothetical protein
MSAENSAFTGQPPVEWRQPGLGREARDQQAERDRVRGAGVPGQRVVQLGEVQRAVLGVLHARAHEDREAGQGGQDQDLERGLQGDGPLQEESGQPVTGERRHLEPDEQVDHVGGQRGADHGGDQQLEQAGVPAELAAAQAAQLGQRVEQQDGADDGRGQGDQQAERVRGERDPQDLAVDGPPVAQVLGDDAAAEHRRRLDQQDGGRAGHGQERDDHGQAARRAGQQRRGHAAGQRDRHRQREQ